MIQSDPRQWFLFFLLFLTLTLLSSALKAGLFSSGYELKRDESLSAWHSFSSDRSLAVCWVTLDWTFSKLLPCCYENLVRRCWRSQTACVLTHWVVILKAKHVNSASIKYNCKINDSLPKTAIFFFWDKKSWFCSKLTPELEPEHVGPFKQTPCL